MKTVRRKGNRKNAADGFQLLRLVICIAAAAALMVIKSLWPDLAMDIKKKLAPVIGEDLDYTEAVSYVNETLFFEKSNGDDTEKETQLPENDVQHKETLAIEDISLRAKLLENASGENEAVAVSAPLCPFENCPPLKAITVTSQYGERNGRFHYGIDLEADKGDEIFAFAAGRVAMAAESITYGNYIILEHEQGWTTLYAHCSELFVRTGDTVTAGERIAAAGESGNANGVHLHFELMCNGECVDPKEYLSGAIL